METSSTLIMLSNTLFPAESQSEKEKVLLPTPDTARNLGYGIWLIMSAKPFKERIQFKRCLEQREGFHCIITLQCAIQRISKNIKIRHRQFQPLELMLNMPIHSHNKIHHSLKMKNSLTLCRKPMPISNCFKNKPI